MPGASPVHFIAPQLTHTFVIEPIQHGSGGEPGRICTGTILFTGLSCSRGLFCSYLLLFCSYLLLFCSYLLLFCSPGTILFTQFESTLAGLSCSLGTILLTGDYPVHRRVFCSQTTILFTTTILHVHTSHMQYSPG